MSDRPIVPLQVGKRRIDFVYEERDSIEVKMPPPRHMREAALKVRTFLFLNIHYIHVQLNVMYKWLPRGPYIADLQSRTQHVYTLQRFASSVVSQESKDLSSISV